MKKVLLVDDDPDFVESIRLILEKEAYQIIVANSGEEGYRKAKSQRPDLIILDVMLETIDKGFEISRRLKQDAELKKIPILMLTAIKEITEMNLNQIGGYLNDIGDPDYFSNPSIKAPNINNLIYYADAFYEKPIIPAEFLNKVKTLLSK